METSNLIALGALIIALIGLIPPFYNMLKNTNSQKKYKQIENSKKIIEESKENKKNKPIPFMLRILVLMAFAVAVLLIELIIFGILAHLFQVDISFTTMPIIWKIAFFSLFIIPGTLVFLSTVILSANMGD